jgi:hypothetical protein
LTARVLEIYDCPGDTDCNVSAEEETSIKSEWVSTGISNLELGHYYTRCLQQIPARIKAFERRKVISVNLGTINVTAYFGK